MAGRLHTPAAVYLPGVEAEQVRASHDRAIRELQASPLARASIVADVELPDATEIPIRHGLGRPARALISAARGASSTGRIEEVRSSEYNRSKVIALKATGWGATITVDVVLL